MSEQVQNLFNNIAPTYDFLNHFLSFGIDKRWRGEALALVSADKSKKMKALDLCAGTLDCSLEFLRQYPESEVTALDFSQKMLERGMKKIPSSLQTKITTICGDGMNPPFPSGCFDVVFCAYGMRNLDDNEQALLQIHRILKPGGAFLALEFFRPQRWVTRLFHATYGKCWLPLMGWIVSGRKGAYSYLQSSVQTFYSLGEYKKLMEAKGFTNVRIRDLLWGISSVVMGEK